MPGRMGILLCPVRGCGEPLERAARALRCARRHSFDVAGSGYCNLLQPQDRRARSPGDRKEVVAARRRWLDAGRGDFLLRALEEVIARLQLPRGAAVLDAGCGEGFFLASLQARFGFEGWGTDISAPAVDLAARRYPGCRWLVLNADRRLPFTAASFHLILSVNGRLNPTEFRRLLAPDGLLLVTVPADDDLAELRSAVLGASSPADRAARVLHETAGQFVLEHRQAVRAGARLDRAAIADALLLTYRGRRSRIQRAAVLEELRVVLAHDLLLLRLRGQQCARAGAAPGAPTAPPSAPAAPN